MNELDNIPAQQPQVIVPLVDLVQGYIEARDRIKQFDEEYDKNVVPLKGAREHFKTEIVKVFKDRKEFSTRVQGATVSLSVRRTAKIVDERALVEHLKKIGLAKDYLAERVTELFKESALEELAKVAIQDDGTVDSSKLPPGVAFQETETISARSNIKKDPRKVLEGQFVKLPSDNN
jgi:hypothetical protein